MCSKCLLDEGTFSGWCPVCGCAMGMIDGEPSCTEEKCWCMDQPDVADWHAMAEDYPPLKSPLPTWEQLKDLFD